ncbi:VCBS repeat-containing protein [Fibrella forsythiae]|uniref:VCBS repeat-containing protein n=1 Tax=Fibrella forsythiae TaxID=2817061 RepID=A0ABS3JED7_9BACT|nr:VCBS repeat-containing protein [Fibrella forsythiae]
MTFLSLKTSIVAVVPSRLIGLLVVGVLGTWISLSCQQKTADETANADEGPALFTLLSPEKTHITFTNELTEGLNTNVLMYEYFYNGGGVAVGDVNNDGLEDLYFSANMTANKLYLNRGKMAFDDVTRASGVAGREGPWKTGVTMADVNADGKLDLFVCYSGKLAGARRINQLFINTGNNASGVPQFTDLASQYGLADSTHSTQAIFFDYDHDTDLDLLLLNHNPKRLTLDDVSIAELAKTPDPQIGIRLMAQEKGAGGQPYFRDVTKQAGLQGSALSYGLGAGVSDINGDGWPDIYVSNDYSIPDYLYINTGKSGKPGFTDQLAKSLGHTSQFSMGNNVSDVNNDALPDIFTLDMLPADNHRQKLLFAPDNYEAFDLNLRAGFNHQYMRNMLHINNGWEQGGKGSPLPTFSEVGQQVGLSNTDWSWSPLFADYDNDGWKDLFVTNGYTRDYTNMDFLKYMGDFLQNNRGNVRRQNLLELVQKMPASGVVSYLFRNNGGKGTLSFTDVSKAWGVSKSANSNGAVYADLDNDGDLDLVVNNINQPAFIYQNEASTRATNHYLTVSLKGAGQNTQGLGATVTLYRKGQRQYLEQMPARGYQSSVSPLLHFGLGADATIDSLRVVWPGGKQQILQQVKADQVLTLNERQASGTYQPVRPAPAAFAEVKSPIVFRQQATTINDFKRQPLLINPMSFSGPCLVKADVNGDGLEDVYAGGGNGQPGTLFLGQPGGGFQPKPVAAFADDKRSDDADAVFFDANGDGFPDLCVASGGYANFLPDDPLLQDRLYLNDGKGNFIKSPTALPALHTSKSCVRVADINGDGKPDLFVGGRVVPGRYPETPPSFLLINDGHGAFADKTAELAPALQRIGMVTDAAWVDLTGDKQPELIIVGEWMPVTVFAKTAGKFTDHTTDFFAKSYKGWWNRLLVGDFNKDGKTDLVVGNMGLNTQCKASDKEPAELIYKDFDDNGSVDPILCFYMQGKTYPYVFRDELLDQISLMRGRFPDYKSYADQTLATIFTPEELQGAARLEANELKTSYFQRGGDGKFQAMTLPQEVQFSPVCAMTSLDYDHDGNADLLLAGNINQARLRFGKSDANYGLLLKGDGRGGFRAVPQYLSGFRLTGDVRSILPINQTLLFGINQQPVRAYRPTKE